MSTKITADHYRRLDEHDSPNAAIMLTPTGWSVATTDPANAAWMIAAEKQVLIDHRRYVTDGEALTEEDYRDFAAEDTALEIGNEFDEFDLDVMPGYFVVITAQGFDGEFDIDYAWYTHLSGLKKVCESPMIGTYQGWCDDEYEVTTEWILYRSDTGRWLAWFRSQDMQSYWVEPSRDEVTGFIRENRERMDEDAPEVALAIARIYDALDEVAQSSSNDIAGYRDLEFISSAIEGPIPAHLATLRSINMTSTIEHMGSVPRVSRHLGIDEMLVKRTIAAY